MKKLITIIGVYFIFPLNTYCQVVIPLDSNKTSNSYDFQLLIEEENLSRIICLGEVDHGVETFNDFKSELILYLHQKYDYEVVAFEVDILNITNAMHNVSNDTLGVESSFYDFWQTASVINLYKYSRATIGTKNPLILSGFDIKSICSFQGSIWLKNLFSFNSRYADSIYKTDTSFLNICEEIRQSTWNQRIGHKMNRLSTKDSARFSSFYSSLIDSLESKKEFFIEKEMLTGEQYKIVKQSLRNRIYSIQFFSFSDFNDANKYRDSTMSLNINWILTELYPNKKIILWAHDAHIAKVSPENDSHINISSVEMLSQELKNQIKSISLDYKKKAPRKLKKVISKLPGNVFFVDKPLYLNKSFDAVIYFDKPKLVNLPYLK